MDILLNGGIPIFTHAPLQLAILPDFVHWDDISFRIDMSSHDEQSFHDSLQRILAGDYSGLYKEKLFNLSRHQTVFDHTQGRQFDLYLKRFAELLQLQ